MSREPPDWSDAGGYLLPADPQIGFRAPLHLHPPAPCLPDFSTTYANDYLVDNDAFHPTDWDDDAPVYSTINLFAWIASPQVYYLEDEMDHSLETAPFLAGFYKPTGQANLPTRWSFLIVINPSPPVHFIKEVICKLRLANKLDGISNFRRTLSRFVIC